MKKEGEARRGGFISSVQNHRAVGHRVLGGNIRYSLGDRSLPGRPGLSRSLSLSSEDAPTSCRTDVYVRRVRWYTYRVPCRREQREEDITEKADTVPVCVPV